jgi:hypothetical protein
VSKKQHLIEQAMNYVQDGKLNLTELRVDDSSLYTRICSIFENIDEFKKEVAPIQCYYDKKANYVAKKKDATYIPTMQTRSLRNELAFQKLAELRRVHSFEEIASTYNVSKQAVQQLFDNLKDFYHTYIDDPNNRHV